MPEKRDEKRIGDWMQTYSGLQFWPLDPRPEDVNIFDIAHALSLICRYGSHCKKFYSVAEHSVLVSQVVPPEDALSGLLHDAPEAYLGDVVRPLKKFLADYQKVEEKMWECIRTAFDLPPLPPSVKQADENVLLTEKAHIMGPSPAPWAVVGEPAKVPICCHSPYVSEQLFLKRYFELWPSLDLTRLCP